MDKTKFEMLAHRNADRLRIAESENVALEDVSYSVDCDHKYPCEGAYWIVKKPRSFRWPLGWEKGSIEPSDADFELVRVAVHEGQELRPGTADSDVNCIWSISKKMEIELSRAVAVARDEGFEAGKKSLSRTVPPSLPNAEWRRVAPEHYTEQFQKLVNAVDHFVASHQDSDSEAGKEARDEEYKKTIRTMREDEIMSIYPGSPHNADRLKIAEALGIDPKYVNFISDLDAVRKTFPTPSTSDLKSELETKRYDPFDSKNWGV